MAGACGPVPISRAAAPNPQMPSNQGFVSIQQFQPMPRNRAPGLVPLIYAPSQDAIGVQWAPGQGGDTPGGGGAACIGMFTAVDTAWIENGLVTPLPYQHLPGTVGFVGSRRSRA